MTGPASSAGVPEARALAGLIERAAAGSTQALARLISVTEDVTPATRTLAALVAPLAGRARIVGITGSPGVGKSTSVSSLVTAFRARGSRVAVLAIDPSSPHSGGAFLGDRVRMQEHATDPDVFIRSLATRGRLGGLAAAVPQATRILDAAGFDIIVIETVGVGQSEVEIAGLADSTIVCLAPGMGDGIQAAKAGLLEVGDVFVVNKADREGADTAARELLHMVGLADRSPGAWLPPVLLTVATRGEGSEGVVSALADHARWQVANGALDRRRAGRARSEVTAIVLAELARRSDVHLTAASDAVRTGRLDAYAAADEVLGALGAQSAGA